MDLKPVGHVFWNIIHRIYTLITEVEDMERKKHQTQLDNDQSVTKEGHRSTRILLDEIMFHMNELIRRLSIDIPALRTKKIYV